MAKDIKEIMSRCFDESVPGSMRSCLTSNTPFKITEDGKTYYVGMLVDINKVGGIGKKVQDSSDMGGMLQRVRGGAIDLFVSDETNACGELLFLPTPNTLSSLSEFGKFSCCNDYEFVKLDANFNIVERTGVKASYDVFRAICSEQADIHDYLAAVQPVIPEEPSELPSDLSLDDLMDNNALDDSFEASIADENSDDTLNEKMSAIDKVKAAAEKVGKVVQNVAEKVADNTGYSDMVNKPIASNVQQTTVSVTNEQSVNNEDEQSEEQIVTYTELQIESSISRIFHADNLDLPVSSEPFDQLFILNNQLISFDFDERDTYVNEHLNIMAADANRDLQKLRADNLKALREKYFMLASVRVIDIQKELDVNNQDTEYGSRKWALENTKRDRLEKIRTAVDERRKVLEDKYISNRDDYCNAAAQRAKTEFNSMHQRSHNDEMDKVEGIIKHEIQAEYEHDMQELYEARKNEALSLLDLNVTSILKELSVDYQAMFETEKALYNKHADAMREYANELHAEDARQIAIAEERNRISNEVNNVRADAAARIDLIKREYESTQAALEARSQVAIDQAENKAQILKEQMAERSAQFEKDKERLQEQLDEAIERAAVMQKSVRDDYEHRLAQAQDDRDSWKQTLETYKEQHKHNNRLATVVVVAVTLAALVGGFMAGGLYWNKFLGAENTTNNSVLENSQIIVVPDSSDTSGLQERFDDNISTVVNVS